MSAASAEPAPRTARESALGVAGLVTGFLILAGIFLWMWISRGRPIDAAEQLKGSFAVAGVPEGWNVALSQAIPDGLFDLSSEQRVLRLVRANVPPEPEPAPPADGSKPEWRKLAQNAAPGEPMRLYLAWYDPRDGGKDVEAQLDSHRAQELEHLGEKGGIVRVDAGRLRWGGYDADFVHERLYEKGAFRDALRVNLSTSGQFCVLNILWGWGVLGTRDSALRALQLFPPRADVPAPR